MDNESNKPQDKSTVEVRKEKDKQAILENLQKIPIVQICCERSNVGRASYYRWRREDEVFAKAADESIRSGLALMNDLAESGLIAQLRDQNMSAIAFWLKHRHKAYKNKVEISGKIKTDNPVLTEEQQAIVDQALALAASGINDKPQDYDNVKPPTGPSDPEIKR